MDWEALRRAAALGVEIGSHTRSHPHLTRLSDDDLQAELTGSREALEANLQRPCRFLAYPYGEMDERVRRAAEDAGYAAAYGLAADTRLGSYGIPRADVYRGDGRVAGSRPRGCCPTRGRSPAWLTRAATAPKRGLVRGVGPAPGCA